MQYGDRPISRPGQDVLGRAGFSLELARAIDQLAVAKDGFVIALCGEWGAGKTSVIELLVRYIRHIEMERASALPILDDKIAHPRTIDQLEQMSAVYERAARNVAELEQDNKNLTYWQRVNRIKDFRNWLGSDEDAEIADRYWRLKVKSESPPKTIVVRFSPWLIAARAELAAALLSELARALGDDLGNDVQAAFADILERLAELAPVGSAAMDLAGGAGIGQIFNTGAEAARKLAVRKTKGPTLDQLRSRLRLLLKGLDNQQILVVVDDLDRLTPDEAFEMVSLVKSLGDLPNVIYLLSCDDVRLGNLIEQAIGVDGRAFLEKIIQYPVHLPIPDASDLTRLLDFDLSSLLGPLSDFDRRRLGYTWYYAFRHYLRTPRDVRRFINSVSVAVSRLRDHVDLIDLILLELMRLYEPEIYHGIRGNLAELSE